MPVERVDPDLVEFDLRSDEMLVNMGPQHPSTHGVLRLVLRTDGEVVGELTPNIGYLHRCAEKIGENLSPRQFLPYADRLDYLASMNMNLGWSLAVEKLLGFVPSERLRHLRVLVCELDRIASHLVAAGCYGLDLGSFTPFMWCFREREKILRLFEELCGARLTYCYITPGGVTSDLPAGWLKNCETFLTEFEPVIDELHATLTSNSIFIRRTANIGVLSPGDGGRLRLHRPGPAGKRRRLGPAPRRRSRTTRGCTKATSSRSSPRSTGSILTTTPTRPFRRRPCWAIAGIASTSACWKSCNR